MAAHPVVVNAALVAYTFRLDPLDVIAGRIGAADFEARRPRFAWSVRAAAHEVILAEQKQSQATPASPSSTSRRRGS